MSFILDALRKAERDRSLGQAPRMEDVALAEAAPSSPANGSLITPRRLLLAALSLAIGASGYLLLTGRPQADPSPAQAVTKPKPAVPAGVVTASVSGPAPRPRTTPAVDEGPQASGPPALPDDGSLTSLDDLATDSDEAVAEIDAEADDVTGTAESGETPRPTDFIARPADDPIARPSQPRESVREMPMASESMTPPSTAGATANAANSQAAELGARPIDEMPNDYRAQFPTLSIEVHAWDSAANKRFAMINGKTYHEGDLLTAGPRLLAITQDGLVLDYRGERVLVSLLR